MATLCRDCAHLSAAPGAVCPACGSYRLISHDALERLSIAHIDCDAFFAAIEKRDNPELRDKPVIIGGGKRGVVATACYIARLHGVHSAMPMFKALKACPEAVIVKPTRGKYSEASQMVRDRLTALSPLVQMVSIDEAYIDLAGTERMHGGPPAQTLVKLAKRVESDVGITVSIGLSSNKFLAKTASELDKPRGFAVIAPEEAPALLGPSDVGALHGVGPKFAAKLRRDGYRQVADLQDAEPRELMRAYGETGLWLSRVCRGIDNRPVTARSERKSVSSERTFNEDISDAAALEDRLWSVCEETAARAKRHGVQGSVITLKLKTRDFRTLTRSLSLSTGTQLAQTLFRAARPLLMRETGQGQSYRLIGIGLSALEPSQSDPIDLVEPGVARRAAAERASDSVRARFGDSAVQTGRGVRIGAGRARN